ncbi:hypothetical protein FA15DRAFT_672671 [Coprinopsis marcescibilis]|uniref:Mid2 domain-containing protein n=1 Tax=Coprinopsis marcescibilis TaxID=230819 RepID=A0A5C3KMD5_COPMA|nr:hypothetical protein FA15DRAFT_672671 [Coprinopsis marcescibilis]
MGFGSGLIPCLLSIALLVHAQSPDGTARLPESGLVTAEDLVGYTGTTYHSIHFEPLCGTLGAPMDNYNLAWDIGNQCETAMMTFNKSQDAVAFFDQSAVKLSGSDVVGTQDVCMCFGLSNAGNSRTGDICVFIDSERNSQKISWFSGRGIATGDWLASSFSPNARPTISVPHCAGADLEALSAEWTATAFVNGASGGREGGGARTVKSTFTVLSTETDPGGRAVATHTLLYPTEVVVKGNLDPEDNQAGLSRSDKIALGVGLGLGVPTLVVAILGAIAKLRKNSKKPAPIPDMESMVSLTGTKIHNFNPPATPDSSVYESANAGSLYTPQVMSMSTVLDPARASIHSHGVVSSPTTYESAHSSMQSAGMVSGQTTYDSGHGTTRSQQIYRNQGYY